MNTIAEARPGLRVVAQGCPTGHDFLLSPGVFHWVTEATGTVMCAQCGLTATVLGATLMTAQAGSKGHPVYVIVIKEDS